MAGRKEILWNMCWNLYASSSISSNPDLPPSLGKSLLTKWKEYGIHQFKHLFTEGSLKSFLDLISEFGIPKQEFYKYLQIRNLITTLKRAG